MAHPGTLHVYKPGLVAFEHAPPPTPNSTTPPTASGPTHTLLFIGGLTDGLLTVHYPAAIAKSLPHNWRLAEVLLSSSYEGWATGSLARDAAELALCVAYFRGLRTGARVVLMGHSTGCQDIMELVVGLGCGAVRIDGAVLQGGVSDREGFEMVAKKEGCLRELEEVVLRAKGLVGCGEGKRIVQVEGKIGEVLDTPMSAYRIFSLLAKGGDDDYFSSDLEDSVLENTFGRFPKETPLCLLLGELDPYVPDSVSKVDLLERWTKIVQKGGGVVDEEHGGIVKGAHHNLNDDPEEAVQELVRRVVGFVKGVESQNILGGSRLEVC
jgi:hypothetical protein